MLYELIVGTLRDVIAYHVGFAFLRLVTGGKYPPDSPEGSYTTKVEIVGVCILVAIVIAVAYLIGALV
jgi:hypothetical protein